jgi:hypothetical protein
MIGYYTPYIFIVKVAMFERSIEEKAAVYLLSIIGNRNDLMYRIIQESFVCRF